MEVPLSELSSTRRMKVISRPDGFMLYGKEGVDFFSTSELLYPSMTIRLRLSRSKLTFHVFSNNTNVSLGIDDCSIYIRRIALDDDSHKKRLHMLAYTIVEFKYLETLGKTFIIPAKQNQFIQQNNFNNAPVRRNLISLNTISAFTGSYTENPFWYQQLDLRQIKVLRGPQLMVHFDAADNCRLYVAIVASMNFQDDIPSIPIDNFKNHYVLLTDLRPMQDATKNCR